MPVAEQIAALLRDRGVAERHSRGLSEYGSLLLRRNERTNLTAAKTPEALVEHLLDSLTLVRYVTGSLVDVGSGAGLPAIPLALVTGTRVTLVESTAKKARFLEEALRHLELDGEVVPQRAELAGRSPEFRDRFMSGTARALGSITLAAELLLPFIAPGGRAALQRGAVTAAERESLEDAALVLNAEIEEVIPVGTGGRHICLVRKAGPTPPRFPRRTGIPAKRPLCA